MGFRFPGPQAWLCLTLAAFVTILPSVIISLGNNGFDIPETLSRRLSTSIVKEDQELPPLFPFLPSHYLGFGVAIIGLLLAAGGGIGGGGILVPTYILLLDFPVKHAIPLSMVTVLGGAVANNILNARKTHPNHSHHPVIDWDLILQLEPMAILGALAGAALNDVLPPLLLVVLMVIVLAATAYETLSKANKLFQQESEALGRQATEESMPLMVKDTEESNAGTFDGSATAMGGSIKTPPVGNDRHISHQSSWMAEDTNQAVWDASKLTGLFSIVTVLNLLNGGGGESGGGPMGLAVCGSECFWVSQITVLVCILLFAIHARSNILWRKQHGGPVLSEIEWDEHNTVIYPIYSIVAGLVAGLFGVGGGIINGPLMLALGVHPAVASATCACMILFTSSTAAASYSIFGLLANDYAVFCLLLGFFSTLLGQTVMTVLLQRFKRNSFIAFAIGGVVAISAVAMSIESVFEILK